MKSTITIGLIIAGFVSSAFGQGTTEFRAMLEPVPGLDWPYEPTIAQFSLSGRVLTGTATYMIPSDTTFIRIENTARTTIFAPTSIVSLAPITAWEATWNDLQLTDTQVNELMQGLWQVDVGGGSYPNGALIGQLEIVPEPSTFVLFGFGAVLVGFTASRRLRR